MLSWYPYVPIGGEMGFNCAILSYNGKAYFGFTCDVGAVPDPESLEKFVDASFAELCRSAKRVKPEAQAEQKARSAAQPSAPAKRAKRQRASRMIPLGGSTPANGKPRKKTVRPAIAQQKITPPKSNGQAIAPAAEVEPQSSSPAAIAKASTPEELIEEFAHAVGA
jgi:hypothetical protein